VIRLALWIIVSLAIAAGITWLISLPGIMTLEVAGYRMQPRLGVAAAVGIGLFVLVIMVWAIVRRVLDAPRYFARLARERRRERAMAALSDGFIALSAGDAHRARKLARDARTNQPDSAAAQLLEARADLALGNMHAAREHYRALIANRKTALAALSGLHDQARAQGRHDAALTFAQKAVAISPQTPWASEAVLDDLTRRGQWQEALDHLAAEPAVAREDKMRKRRKQAVIETARAREVEGTDPLKALDHALAALKLVPDFVPAALIAARIHSHRGEARRAMSLLRRVWRASSHPDIALLYAAAVPGASAVDRLKRVRELIDQPPANRVAAIVLARAAIDAFEWSTARNALAPYASSDPSQNVCLLMAEIEEGQTGDHGKAREWLARAVRAPRDPAWTADGITVEDWQPVSPVTGRLDAFEWRVPLTATGLARPVPPLPSPRPAAEPEDDATSPIAAGKSLALPES
jgi:HemY protein